MHGKRHTYAVVVLLALLVHAGMVGVACQRTGQADGYAFRSLDAGEYYTLAGNLLDHRVFSVDAQPPFTPDTWRTPGYPAVLAASMAVVGRSPGALIAAQVALSIINVLLVFSVGRSVMSDHRAFVLALLFLVAPYRLFYTLWLLATTVFTTALLITWIAWRWWRATPTVWGSVVVGLLSGVCVLIRPIAMLVPFALALGAIMVSIRLAPSPGWTRWRRVSLPLAVLVGGLAVTGGWSARNCVVAGHWGLSSQSGVVLAYFKAAEVELWRQGRSGDRYKETSLDESNLDKPHTVWDAIDGKLQDQFSELPEASRNTLTWRTLAQGNRGDHDPFVVSTALGEIARDMLLTQPLSTGAFCAGRCVMALTFPLHLAFGDDLTIAQRLKQGAVGGLFLVLLVAVVVRILRGRLGSRETFFPLICCFCLLLATAPQLYPRFRVPMIPLLLFVALLPRRAGESVTSENECTDSVDIGRDVPQADNAFAAPATDHALPADRR